jgi:hypothetical protein
MLDAVEHLGNGCHGIVTVLRMIATALPCLSIVIDSDKGGEFINEQLWFFCYGGPAGVQFTCLKAEPGLDQCA